MSRIVGDFGLGNFRKAFLLRRDPGFSFRAICILINADVRRGLVTIAHVHLQLVYLKTKDTKAQDVYSKSILKSWDDQRGGDSLSTYSTIQRLTLMINFSASSLISSIDLTARLPRGLCFDFSRFTPSIDVPRPFLERFDPISAFLSLRR